MELDVIKTSDGKGYQFSMYGNMHSKQFKKQVKDTSVVLRKKFQKVAHSVRRKNDNEYHTYRAYGNKYSTQIGAGPYFTYDKQNAMSDMSCYIVAHIRRVPHRDGLWQFMREEREESRQYCNDIVIPHITLYEYHLNCNTMTCPSGKFDYEQHQWLQQLAHELIVPTYNFLHRSDLRVRDNNRYAILGRQMSNKFIAMILQLTAKNGGNTDTHVNYYRSLLLRTIMNSLDTPLQMCGQQLGDSNFTAYCDSMGTEVLAVPNYHIGPLLPHVSLGSINCPEIQVNLNAFDHEHDPEPVDIPTDIRYLEVSFKNFNKNFFYHYVYNITSGKTFGINDDVYKIFKQKYLDLLP